MQDLGTIDAIGGAAKKLGTGIGRLFEKVNPDVWRELGYVTMSSYSLLLPRREEVVDRGADGAIPGIAVTDTIKVVADDGEVVDTPDRTTLVAVQTPQAFRADVLRAAHAGGESATDDAALVEAAGGRVVVVDGEDANRKITSPEDLEWARRFVDSEGISGS